MVIVVNLLDVVENFLILFGFWINDLIIWIFIKFLWVIVLMFLIFCCVCVKYLVICCIVISVIFKIIVIMIIMIYYCLGIVIIVRISVLMNSNGIWVICWKLVIIICWIWLILFVICIIKLDGENFFMLV